MPDPESLAGLSDRFEILAELGSGASGSVFHVHDKILNRQVAIKVLHAGCDGSVIARFQREAQALSRLNHPNLVTVLDFGIDAKNRPYLVMEYLPGTDLKSLIKSGALPHERAVKIAGQVCDALSHSHEKGILHRDVKPSNIIVKTINGQEQVKLVDFGLAKLAEQQEPTLTNPAIPIGTVLYLSPEIISGKPADARSDIYSLGCVIFECLTGRPPFISDSAQTTMMAHLNRIAPRPSYRNREVPQYLDRVVENALKKDPELRFQSAGDLKKALEQNREIVEPQLSQTTSLVFESIKPLEAPGKAPPAVLLVSAAIIVVAAIAYGAAVLTHDTDASAWSPRLDTGDMKEGERDQAKDNSALFETADDLTNADFKNGKLTFAGQRTDSQAIDVIKSKEYKSIHIRNRKLSQPLMQAVADHGKNLEGAIFENCSGLNYSMLLELTKLPKLNSIILPHCQLDDDSIKALSECPELGTLGLDNNSKITGHSLLAFQKHKNLTRLYIANTSVTPRAIKEFLANKPPKLENIRLSQLKLTDDDIYSFDLHGLKTINLSGNQALTDKTAKYIASNSNIRHVHFTKCPGIEDGCLMALKKLPIETLVAAQTNLKSLKGLKEFTSLKDLDLRGCTMITDESLKELPPQGLSKITLDRTAVSDEGLRTIVSRGPSSLETRISVSNCLNISEEGRRFVNKQEGFRID